MHILELTKDHPEIAEAEALALIQPKIYRKYENFLMLESKLDLFTRLAYTNKVFKVLFHCKESEVEFKTAMFPWKKYYEDSFSVKKIGKGIPENSLADMVG